MRPLSDGERAILAQDGPDDAIDYVLLRTSRGVVRRGRRCTLCAGTMPPGARYTETVALIEGRFDVFRCCEHGEEPCPVPDRPCDACQGFGGFFRPASGGAGEEVEERDPCSACCGTGRVAKAPGGRDRG